MEPGTWGWQRIPSSLSHLLHLGPSQACPMQITQEPHLHTHQPISIFPALGGSAATGQADSSPFCFRMPSRELLLHPSNWGEKRKREKRKGKGEKKPQDKETGTIWATGRKCHCLEFGPWGKRAMQGQAWGPLEWEILDLSELAPFPASSLAWLWPPGQVTERLVPPFPRWGNGTRTPACGCYLAWSSPPDSAPVFTPAGADPGRGRDPDVRADPAAGARFQPHLRAWRGPALPRPFISQRLSFPPGGEVRPSRAGSLAFSPKPHVYGDDHGDGGEDDHRNINSICNWRPSIGQVLYFSFLPCNDPVAQVSLQSSLRMCDPVLCPWPQDCWSLTPPLERSARTSRYTPLFLSPSRFLGTACGAKPLWATHAESFLPPTLTQLVALCVCLCVHLMSRRNMLRAHVFICVQGPFCLHGGEEHEFCDEPSWVQIPALLVARCVTSSKLLDLSSLSCPICEMGVIVVLV